jgi:hypothetical protein
MADVLGSVIDLPVSSAGITAGSSGAVVSNDTLDPVISNVTPASGGNLASTFNAARLTPVEFDVTDNGTLSTVVIWCKFLGKEQTFLVYDGDDFVAPFDSSLSARTVISGGFHFVVAHTGAGWPASIEELVVRAVDSGGNVGE